ncbi:MAG: hypothetical protein WC356_01415 [Candidatus Micrarchaeia archaeon]
MVSRVEFIQALESLRDKGALADLKSVYKQAKTLEDKEFIEIYFIEAIEKNETYLFNFIPFFEHVFYDELMSKKIKKTIERIVIKKISESLKSDDIKNTEKVMLISLINENRLTDLILRRIGEISISKKWKDIITVIIEKKFDLLSEDTVSLFIKKCKKSEYIDPLHMLLIKNQGKDKEIKRINAALSFIIEKLGSKGELSILCGIWGKEEFRIGKLKEKIEDSLEIAINFILDMNIVSDTAVDLYLTYLLENNLLNERLSEIYIKAYGRMGKSEEILEIININTEDPNKRSEELIKKAEEELGNIFDCCDNKRTICMYPEIFAISLASAEINDVIKAKGMMALAKRGEIESIKHFSEATPEQKKLKTRAYLTAARTLAYQGELILIARQIQDEERFSPELRKGFEGALLEGIEGLKENTGIEDRVGILTSIIYTPSLEEYLRAEAAFALEYIKDELGINSPDKCVDIIVGYMVQRAEAGKITQGELLPPDANEILVQARKTEKVEKIGGPGAPTEHKKERFSII